MQVVPEVVPAGRFGHEEGVRVVALGIGRSLGLLLDVRSEVRLAESSFVGRYRFSAWSAHDAHSHG